MKPKTIIITAALGLFTLSRARGAGRDLKALPIRNCDIGGCGHFGASRGDRLHNGIDLLAAAGTTVKTSFTGKVERYIDPYGDGQYNGLQIREMNTGHVYKIMYLNPSVKIGETVSKGSKIGTVQDISKKYKGVPHHLHIELIINGSWVDPAPYLKPTL